MSLDLSKPWHSLPIAVIDTETSGLAPDGRVVEIAAVRFEGGVPVARFCSLVNPGHPIPEGATGVHGITDAMVSSAPRLADVAAGLLRVCRDAAPCAYNAPFDRFMLHSEVTGTDCMAFDSARSWLDVMIMAKHFDRFARGTGRHKLVNVCARNGIEIKGAHRAEADAIACGALLWAFKSKLGDVSAENLIKRCDERRAEQEADYQAWKARQLEAATDWVERGGDV